MNSSDPSTLKSLSSNHTVIIFDNRGVANTTTGSKAFSIQQFANDTVGLLDALKIQKADVLAHSLGEIVAQQLAVTHPEKVNRLILVSIRCVITTSEMYYLIQMCSISDYKRFLK